MFRTQCAVTGIWFFVPCSQPFPPSRFWSLTVCKNRGGGGGRPGSFYHVNDISVYLGRQRGRRVPNQKNAFHAHTLCFEPGVVHFSFSNVTNSSVWGTNHKISLQAHSFNGGPLPPSVYLGRHWHHLHDKIDQAFLSLFTYCKWSKTGRWEGLVGPLHIVTITVATIYVVQYIHMYSHQEWLDAKLSASPIILWQWNYNLRANYLCAFHCNINFSRVYLTVHYLFSAIYSVLSHHNFLRYSPWIFAVTNSSCSYM